MGPLTHIAQPSPSSITCFEQLSIRVRQRHLQTLSSKNTSPHQQERQKLALCYLLGSTTPFRVKVACRYSFQVQSRKVHVGRMDSKSREARTRGCLLFGKLLRLQSRRESQGDRSWIHITGSRSAQLQPRYRGRGRKNPITQAKRQWNIGSQIQPFICCRNTNRT